MGVREFPPEVNARIFPVLAAPGMGFSRVELIQLKMVLLAPIPKASVSIAVAVKPGDFSSTRNA